jgi:uncharacterized membrane protein
MVNNIDQYLDQLKAELAGCDRATVQDAVSDTEEYLRNALYEVQAKRPGLSEAEAWPRILEKYGMPEEVALAYKAHENRPLLPALPESQKKHSALSRFFGVAADWKVWSALIYFVLSLGTGIAYFTWVVTGISLSAGLLVLIIGIPFAGLFMLSVWGISLIEGRIVEALLGVRMPRRPAFSDKHLGLWARFKTLISDRYTYLSMLYMILQLPLGIVYFTVFVTLIAVSASLVALPLVQLVFHQPLFRSPAFDGYFVPGWLVFLAVIAGILLFFSTLHLTAWVGRLHAKWAKMMLVRA